MPDLLTKFEFCSTLMDSWKGGLPVSHLHLREEQLGRDKPPTTYLCPRCGVDVMKERKGG